MITTKTMPFTGLDDSELVSRSLAGNRDAFGQIVSRYQSLICSLAYSAIGSLGQSEDLAQETFITAWCQLAGLREPAKLRSWLCGIARNLIGGALRREGREPVHAAESIDEVAEAPAPGPSPTDLTMSREEESILWRSLERIPEIYREPLILFYREHESAAQVAQALDLTEETVHQRLSRGRKLLQEQVVAFVEGALERTRPDTTFTNAVLATLPALTFSAKAAAGGATAVAGGATVKTAGFAALGALLGPLVVVAPNYVGYRFGLASMRSEVERAWFKAYFRRVTLITVALFIPFVAVVLWFSRGQADRSFLSGVFATGLALIYLPTMWLCLPSTRKRREHCSKVLAEEFGGVFPKASWEYRSRATFLGLPLVHVRLGDRFCVLKEPVKAWIAMGDRAIGGLFAFGGLAVAPVSVGGLCIGLFSFGGLSIGALAMGGIATGIWPLFGGLLVGWQAFGGCLTVGWSAAAGDFALAHGFALGRAAWALQANNDVAHQFIEASWAFQLARFIGNHWLWVNLFWIIPFSWVGLKMRRARAEYAGAIRNG